MARTGFAFTGQQNDADVVAAVTGKTIKILRLQFTTSAAATVAFSDGADAAATRIIYGDFPATGGVIDGAVSTEPSRKYVAILTKATALKVTTSAGNLKGVVEYDVSE